MQIKRFEILHFVFTFNQFYQMSQITSKITMNNIRKFILQLQAIYILRVKLYYDLKKKTLISEVKNLKATFVCILKCFCFILISL